MDNPRILITGANGQLGKELKKISPSYPQFEYIFLSREDLPVHHFEMVRQYFKTYRPQYLINCAAYTAVDRAEQEKDLAFQINGEAVGVLAAVCKENNCRFIHISTDYVFDGAATTPYKEIFPPHPINVYGASKLEGEKQALQLNPDSIIIRTSWLYSEYGKNFARTMLRLMKEKKEINIVNDQMGSPTYAVDLAEAILQIISLQQWQPGIYNFSNEGIISWYDFALSIKELSGSSCKISPIPTSQYPTPAKRPMYSVLDKTKIQEIFGIKLKNWRECLAVCLKKLRMK
ncbi:MAG: dTDP-4-dehydrorhamnose reductase [Sphingobacteriales bacterium]|nr:dTDP-4-dehydrorhamnose reductase [Sphingobacteriales bacterium]